MFTIACEAALAFTRPLVVSWLPFEGPPLAGIGAYMVLNNEGWIATVAHNLEVVMRHNQQRDAIAAFDAAPTGTVKPEDNWIRQASAWFSDDNARIVKQAVYPELDLALVQLSGIDLSGVTQYPRFKDPQSMKFGTSIVRVGYPFYEVQTSWEASTGRFSLATPPMPLFPIEGIVTRFIEYPTGASGIRNLRIEGSSPGLRGQSGGPILDRDGAVWAMQSMTTHWPLGFSPPARDDQNQTVHEHQFLNTGVGVHGATLLDAFREQGITVAVAP
jgi:hypothetical protein